MNLKVPKAKAIQILRQRISELSEHHFNSKVWKDKTENDLKEILPLGSMQWLQVSKIQFETLVTSDKQKVLQEGKDTGRRLLNSYIDFIENYSEIAEQKQLIVESNWQERYSKLLSKWNDLVSQWNKLLEEHRTILAENEAKNQNIENLNNEIVKIKENTVQFENISLGKVLKAIKNMPIGQLIAVIGFLIGLVIGSFRLGLLYQENSMNSANYQLNKRNDTNQELLKQKNKQIIKLQNENSNLKQKPKTDTISKR